MKLDEEEYLTYRFKKDGQYIFIYKNNHKKYYKLIRKVYSCQHCLRFYTWNAYCESHNDCKYCCNTKLKPIPFSEI